MSTKIKTDRGRRFQRGGEIVLIVALFGLWLWVLGLLTGCASVKAEDIVWIGCPMTSSKDPNSLVMAWNEDVELGVAPDGTVVWRWITPAFGPGWNPDLSAPGDWRGETPEDVGCAAVQDDGYLSEDDLIGYLADLTLWSYYRAELLTRVLVGVGVWNAALTTFIVILIVKLRREKKRRLEARRERRGRPRTRRPQRASVSSE